MSTCGRQLDTSDHTTKEEGRHIKFKKEKAKKEKAKKKKKREEKNKTSGCCVFLSVINTHSKSRRVLKKCGREFKLEVLVTLCK